MRYLLFCCADERALATLPQAEWQAVLCATRAYVDELRSRGRLIASEALESAYAATTIRTRGGKLSTTDGPFAETKEQVRGFPVGTAWQYRGSADPAIEERMKYACLIYYDETLEDAMSRPQWNALVDE